MINFTTNQLFGYQAVNAFHIFLFVLVLMYFRKLEKTGCKCFDDWKRKYITGVSMIFLLIAGVNMFSPGFLMKLFGDARANIAISVLLGIVYVVYVLSLVLYTEDVVVECGCTGSWKRSFLQFFYILAGITIVIGFIIALKTANPLAVLESATTDVGVNQTVQSAMREQALLAAATAKHVAAQSTSPSVKDIASSVVQTANKVTQQSSAISQTLGSVNIPISSTVKLPQGTTQYY
jgi:hypothetical protein